MLLSLLGLGAGQSAVTAVEVSCGIRRAYIPYLVLGLFRTIGSATNQKVGTGRPFCKLSLGLLGGSTHVLSPYASLPASDDSAASLYCDPGCIIDSHRAILCTVTGSAMCCLTPSMQHYILQEVTHMRGSG